MLNFIALVALGDGAIKMWVGQKFNGILRVYIQSWACEGVLILLGLN